ncbi:MAG: hypothetical protein LC737_00065 [Chloroflexi bacterium]|nr:hypothetical protein [Chloroflexota bacterium]
MMGYVSPLADLCFVSEQTLAHGNQVARALRAYGAHPGTLVHILPIGRDNWRRVSFLKTENGRTTKEGHV